ncbi:MAG: NAD(P)H-dependent oxidoreductase [Actinomycetota bacterium]|nr:NAD(P)H-dependent oxidoreductase [Actinomycetota bacterium]
MRISSAQPMTRIGIIVGSTRPGRRGTAVARWVEQATLGHTVVTTGQASVEVVDLAAQALPLLDEPVPAMFTDYRNPHTRRWSAVISSFDAFVFVTPEYNHSLPAALKNAIDFLYFEWGDKAAGLVSYGVQGGLRASDHLRLVMAEVRAAVVPTQVSLSVFTDFDFSDFDASDPTAAGVLRPGAGQEQDLTTMLAEVSAWSHALRGLRAADPGMGANGSAGLEPDLATERAG